MSSPALIGLIEQLEDGQPITAERREAFLAAMISVVEFVYPSEEIDEELLELEAGDEIEIEEQAALPHASVVDRRSGTNVKWFEVMRSLVDGVLDVFECDKKASGAATIKSELMRKYPGCIVNIKPHKDDDLATISVRVGAYRG